MEWRAKACRQKKKKEKKRRDDIRRESCLRATDLPQDIKTIGQRNNHLRRITSKIVLHLSWPAFFKWESWRIPRKDTFTPFLPPPKNLGEMLAPPSVRSGRGSGGRRREKKKRKECSLERISSSFPHPTWVGEGREGERRRRRRIPTGEKCLAGHTRI